MIDKVISILMVGLGIFIAIMFLARIFWDTSPCPHCGTGISKSAKVCKHCGRDIA